MNNGAPNSTNLPGKTLDQVSTKLVQVAKERGLILIKKQELNARSWLLAFKSGSQNKAITQGSGYSSSYSQKGTGSGSGSMSVSTVNLEQNSKYFAKLSFDTKATHVEIVGVPILNNEMSCPKVVAAKFVRCVPPKLTTLPGRSLASVVKEQWGYDVSGQAESEIIEGIIAELK